ncbi:MAG TPA: 6-carboxytetrahydropterin synthase [Vicinamibacterales bacterium]|nr:6-carboxytetrahydropterin synthase [Vicinamibacterales bacterium]
MEKITVHTKFHAGHRLLGYPGACRFVHGHTWRGTVTIATEAFPRDERDITIDFGRLKQIMRDLDHKMLVTANDPLFTNAELFDPEGVVVLEGQGPSVETVAGHVWERVVQEIRRTFSDRGLDYRIEVMIQESENNIFVIDRHAVV